LSSVAYVDDCEVMFVGGGQAELSLLLIEDHEDTRISLAHLLRNRGCRVVEAGSAREARGILETLSFDGILVDLGLPDQDGHTFAAELRNDPKFSQRTAFIATTGFADRRHREQSEQAGFVAHLVKPYPIEALWSAIAAIKASVGAK